MKKKSLLIFSTSFALGVIALGAGCANLNTNEANKDTTLDDAVLPDDGIGTRIKLGENSGETTATTPITFDATLGYRVIDETSGAKSVRVYAALNGYKGLKGASLTRKVTASDGTSVKEEKTYQVNYVYSSIKDADLVTWDTPISTEIATPYYMVYTLKDISETHWLDKVSVQFAVDNGQEVKSGEALYNVRGLIGDETEGVEYVKRADVTDKDEYYARAKNKSIEKAVVASTYYTYEGHVAAYMGEVTAIDATSSTGAFEGCSYLTEVVLPDTINFFGNYSFYRASSLEKIRLPKNLSKLTNSTWSNVSIKEIQWDAIALTNESNATFGANLDKVTISSSVTSLPNTFMGSSYKIKKVVYDGPIAQFEALKTDDNKDNGLFVDDVYASDNTVEVTYHLGEASIGGETGDYTTGGFTNKAFTPATPSLAGHKFDGWFTDEALTNQFVDGTVLTGNIDLYPKFSEFGPGATEENPIVLGETNTSFTETLVPGYEGVYFKYTAPTDSTAKWHYLRINESNSVTNTDLSIGVTSLGNQKIFVYKDSVSEDNLQEESSSTYLTDTKKVQKVYSDDGFKRVWIEPGETYYFYADAYYSSFYKDREWYGDLNIEWKTFDNDTAETALSMTYGEEVTPTVLFGTVPASLYKFKATATKSASIFITSYKNYYVYIKCFDVTDSSNIKKVAEAKYNYSSSTSVTSTTSSKTIDLVEGHTYVFQPSCNENSTSEKYFTFKLDDSPAGTSISNPIAYTLGEKITSTDLGLPYVYYSFTLDAEKNVSFTLDGGSTYYAKMIQLFKDDGSEVTSSIKEEGTEDSSGWGGSDVYYGGSLNLTKKLQAGNYVLKVAYDSSSTTTSNISISSKILEEGDTFESALTVEIVSNSVTLNASVDGKYYKVTAESDGFMQFESAASDGVKVALLDSNGKQQSYCSNGGTVFTKVTAGQTVYLKAFGATGTASLTITYPSSIQDGTSRDTAYQLDFGESGEVDITSHVSSETSINSCFFTFTVTDSGTYRFYSNSNSLDTKVNAIYEEGSTSSLTLTGNKDDDNNAHSGYTHYRYDFYVEVELEAGKTYYADVKLAKNANNDTQKVGLSMLKQGETVTNPLEKSFVDDTMTITSNTKSMFYSFVASETNTFDFVATAATSGVEVTLKLYKDGSVVTATNTNRYDLVAGTTYVLNVITSATSDVNITKTVYVGPFTGSPVIGQYIGCQNGDSYYKCDVNADGVAWESSLTHYGPSGETSTTSTGLTKFVSNTNGEKTFYANGTDMWVVDSSNNVFLLSKRLTTYSSSAVNGSIAKTTDASMTSGVIIQSIHIDDGTTIYGMVKDGEVYLGITVEFTAGENLKDSNVAFTVKDSSNNLIGSYTGASGTLTSTNA